MRPRWLLAQVQYWALRGLLALLQERFMSKWWHWSKVEAWNFTIKTFKTCQFNESKLFICRIKSEHNCSGENASNMHVSWMMLWKQGASKIFKCWNSVVVFPIPNKISGYAPGSIASIYQKILCFAFDLIYVVIISSSIFYLSKQTKFELIITILSTIVSIWALRINVFSY